MNDEVRFEAVANDVMQDLKAARLPGVKTFRRQWDGEDEGWWRRLAKLKDGLYASVYYGRYLDENKRLFWFGFESEQRDSIDGLVKELGTAFEPHYVFNDEDGENEAEYHAIVRRNFGLGEDHDESWHFFGKYEIGFEAKSDDALAQEAARFIEGVWECADPSFAESRDIAEIKNDPRLNPTERLALVNMRLGQGGFRRNLIDIGRGARLVAAELLKSCAHRTLSRGGSPRRTPKRGWIPTMAFYLRPRLTVYLIVI